jgi:hypothetical protein
VIYLDLETESADERSALVDRLAYLDPTLDPSEIETDRLAYLVEIGETEVERLDRLAATSRRERRRARLETETDPTRDRRSTPRERGSRDL